MPLSFTLRSADGAACGARSPRRTARWRRRVHARRHPGHGQRSDAGNSSLRRARSFSATPITSPCGRATTSSAPRRPPPLHGLGRADPHRLRRVPGVQPGRPAKIADHGVSSSRTSTAPRSNSPRNEACRSSRTSAPTSPWCSTNARPGRRRAAKMRAAVRRTILWAERCRARHDAGRSGPVRHRARRASGPAARAECARALVGAWISPATRWAGSVSAKSPKPMHARAAEARRPAAGRQAAVPDGRRPPGGPAGRRRGAAIDMFDCVMPTRNGRNALAFTADGPIRLRNARHRRDPNPVAVRLSVLLLCELLARVPAPPVPGRRDVRADAPESAQHRVLLAVDGRRPAGDHRGAVRGLPRRPPCPLEHGSLN